MGGNMQFILEKYFLKCYTLNSFTKRYFMLGNTVLGKIMWENHNIPWFCVENRHQQHKLKSESETLDSEHEV